MHVDSAGAPSILHEHARYNGAKFMYLDNSLRWPVEGAHQGSGAEKITISGGTWDEGEKKLTKVGAFASYSLQNGDEFVVTGGTGGTPGTYGIQTRIDDDSITFGQSPGFTDGTSDVAGTLTSSILTNASRVQIQGLLMSLTAGAAGSVVIFKHDGTTAVHTMTVNNVGILNPAYLPIAGPEGLELDGGFSAISSSGLMIGYVIYKDLTPQDH